MNEEARRPPSDMPTSSDPVLETAKYIRHVLNAADVGTWHFDRGEEEVYFDAPARRMLGLDDQRVLSLAHALQLIHPDDRGQARRVFQNALNPSSGGHHRVEFRVAQEDRRWVRTQGRVFFDEDGSLRQAFGVVLDVTDQKEIEDKSRLLVDTNHKLQTEVDRSKALEQEVLKAADEERSRIARELHDGLQQHLTGMSLQLEMLERDIRESRESVMDRLGRLREQLRSAAYQARTLSRRLMPVTIRDHGLVGTLKKLCEDLDAASDRVKVTFEAAPEAVVESDETATHLYRIVQEAANNAFKHARARSIHVTLTSDGSKGELTIEDDGDGFDPDGDHRSEGIGLRTMRYRADLIGGELDVASTEGGTSVRCTFRHR